ncbi:hypothetical protein M6B38_279815 [Iris pallida]|uniref:Uncharacterized protein n=1 Tax=Iris pallida TaxID=29817 RepID=A0AAX6HYW3_IRIPA|nr:hypothetical protein M6B38_279815 [Iris pallida]
MMTMRRKGTDQEGYDTGNWLSAWCDDQTRRGSSWKLRRRRSPCRELQCLLDHREGRKRKDHDEFGQSFAALE